MSLVGVIAGVVQAFVWAALAPRERWVVLAKDGSALPLPTESSHRFTSIGLFALMSLLIGIELAVAAWQIRFARGPEMLLAVGLGCAVGSAAALLIGPRLAGGVFPNELVKTSGRPTHDLMVSMPPSITWVLVVVAPLLGVAVYTFVAAWHQDAELGRPRPRVTTSELDLAGRQSPTGASFQEQITAPIPIIPVSRPR
ncbi:MAG: DUF2567 domain-containing protein [Actinomycetota bacterium]|nr:DUF2567 domain-containing protein [Actinomycetota bacterium]